MYECTICGQTRDSIDSNPEYDFRRLSTRPEERTVVGSSDYCSRCQQLSFFINLEDSGDEALNNASDWVFQGFRQQTVESASSSDLQNDHSQRPPQVPVLQERHYLRKLKPARSEQQQQHHEGSQAPLTEPARSEHQQHNEGSQAPLTEPARSEQQQHPEGSQGKKPPLTEPARSEQHQQQRQATPLTPRSASLQQHGNSSPGSPNERHAAATHQATHNRHGAAKCPACSCCHFKSGSSRTTQQQPMLKIKPIYPVEDMHMQQIARYARHPPKATSGSHSTLNSQQKIKKKLKLMKSLTRIQCGEEGELDAGKGEPMLGERLMDVLREKSGGRHKSEARRLQQQKSLSIVQRCNYEPIISNPCPATGIPATWPTKSQFNTILKSQKTSRTALKKLHIRCNPIKCPVADCRRVCFVSGIISHIKNYHRTVTIDGMGLRQTRTYFLDPNATRLNQARCHQMFVVQGKIINAEKQLPVLLMSARVRPRDAIGRSSPQDDDNSQELLLLWLTTVKPTNGRIFGTLAVGAADLPDTMMVTTARTYNIRDSLQLGALLASPSIMAIPHAALQCLSSNRQQLMAIQVQIY